MTRVLGISIALANHSLDGQWSVKTEKSEWLVAGE